MTPFDRDELVQMYMGMAMQALLSSMFGKASSEIIAGEALMIAKAMVIRLEQEE